jgi:hypothetical protein
MRVILDTNVLVSAALKQHSMLGMAVLLVERRGALLNRLRPSNSYIEVVARPYFKFKHLIDPAGDAWLKKLMAGRRAGRHHREDRRLPRFDGRQVFGAGDQRPCRFDLIVSGDGDLLSGAHRRQ